MENKEKTTVQAKERKPVTNIGDQVLISVKSGFYGKLIYESRRSGLTVIWNKAGDIQTMSMRDLREMKAEQIGFFRNQWVIIEGVAAGERCKATVEDICRNLVITQYYENMINPQDFEKFCAWSDKEIVEKVNYMSEQAKSNLIVAISGYIADGKIDSIKKIRTLEKVLDCDFGEIN